MSPRKPGCSVFIPTQTAAWFDYNGDGWLDVFIGNESTEGDDSSRANSTATIATAPSPNAPQKLAWPSSLRQRRGQRRFQQRRPARPLSLAAVAARTCSSATTAREDANGSPRRMEIHRCRRRRRRHRADAQLSHLVLRLRQRRLAGSLRRRLRHARMSATVAADYLGLPHERRAGAALSQQRRRHVHRRHRRPLASTRCCCAMGANFGDLDNDGWLDFYVGTGDPDFSTLIPNRMFRNDGGKCFQDVTTSGGFGHLQKGHGIAFGDLDNDGDQDIYARWAAPMPAIPTAAHCFSTPATAITGSRSSSRACAPTAPPSARASRSSSKTAAGERSIYKTVGTGGSFRRLAVPAGNRPGPGRKPSARRDLLAGHRQDPDPQGPRNGSLLHRSARAIPQQWRGSYRAFKYPPALADTPTISSLNKPTWRNNPMVLLRVLIADDESLARERLRQLL